MRFASGAKLTAPRLRFRHSSSSQQGSILVLCRTRRPAVPCTRQRIGLTNADFAWAAGELRCFVTQIRAVDEVESGGGWYQDVCADILDVDGPGGFVDGSDPPRILFEAHIFDRESGGKFRAS